MSRVVSLDIPRDSSIEDGPMWLLYQRNVTQAVRVLSQEE
jgi:hypothetical protein